MFEMAGLVFGAAVFFGFSLVLGASFAYIAWLLLRRRRLGWAMIFVASAVPPVCAVYMAACLVLFPGVSLFGDIDEPLPHGYALKALGKMPEYATIDAATGPLQQPQIEGWVGEVDLEGDTLFGKYSEGFGEPDDKPKWCCFAFNTATGEVKNFATPAEMNASAGKSIATEEVQYFRSREPRIVRTRRLQNWILLTPPATAVLLLLGLLLCGRFATSPEPA